MAREDLHFRLRIPEELKAKVEESASDNHRSMTAEIIARLEESFAVPTNNGIKGEDLARTTKALSEAIAEIKGETRHYIFAMRFILEQIITSDGKLNDTTLEFAKRLLTDDRVLTERDQPASTAG